LSWHQLANQRSSAATLPLLLPVPSTLRA